MARDTLGALLRLRRLAVDDAARTLGAAIADADQARQDVTRLTESLTQESAVTRALATKDPALAPFAAWRARIQQTLVQARLRQAQADAAVAAAQDALGAARGAARAIETVIARRLAEAEREAGRAAQLTLDDVARGQRTQGAGVPS